MKKVIVRIMMKSLEVKEFELPLCRAQNYVMVMKQKGFDCDIIK